MKADQDHGGSNCECSAGKLLRTHTEEHSVAAYSDAGCRAAVLKEPAAQENGNPPKETTKGPRPEPDHLPEEPAFVTFLKGGNVLGSAA